MGSMEAENKFDKLSASRILDELYNRAKVESDGKVHIRNIKDGYVRETIEKN